MKRRISLIVPLVLVLAGLVVGITESSDAKEKKFTVGVALAYFDHPVYQLEMKGMREIAEKEGVELLFVDGKNDPALQVSQVESFIARKVDGIILNAAVADPMLPVIEKVNKTGIPLVLLDRKIWKRGRDVHWIAFVGWNMLLSGAIGGAEAVAALQGSGKVVVVEGTPGAGSTLARASTFYPILEQFPDIEIVHKTQANFKRDMGLKVTEDLLTKFPKGTIDLIYYMNDEMALGGLQAIKAAGRLEDLKIVSVDGDHEALEAVRRGEIDYDCIFHPDDHAVVVTVMAQALKGEKLSDVYYFHGRKVEVLEFEGHPWVRPTCYWVDKDNANEPGMEGW